MAPSAARASGADSAAKPAATLTEWLRRRTDEQLTDLLRRRPDLALPAPGDLATLASRLSVRSSVQRAVDQLDAFTLRVLEAAVLSASPDDHASAAATAKLLNGADPTPALQTLRQLTLIWGEDDRLRLVSSVTDAVGPYPAGLGRPIGVLLRTVSDVLLAPVLRNLDLPPATQPTSGLAIRDALSDPERVAGVIEDCGTGEREVLSRLAGGPPVGVVRNAFTPAEISDAASPPHRLIARGLLVPIDIQTVELPREVGLALRGGVLDHDLATTPPPLQVTARTPDELDRLAGTAVLETLRLVERLAGSWTRHAPSMLRAGGVGTRELRRTARDLDVSEELTALIIEVAAAAGLVGSTSVINPVYLPTTEFDHWVNREPSQRWVALASAWLGMSRQPSLINQRDERERLISALGPDVERGTVISVRRSTLAALAELPRGTAPNTPTEVLTRLAWLAPRRAGGQRAIAEAVLAEAELLGFTGAGGLTDFGRALLDGAPADANAALVAALPKPISEFLLQPDLTAVVPGPPTPELAQALTEAADLESSGGASVYRITEATLRRALDAGRTSAELAEFFRSHSRTPVPQGLSYLIEDVTRRHGVLRTGTASSYLRCDDESLLARVLLDSNLGALDLRRLAPTVVISSAPVARVLELLRGAGYAPSGEAADGAILNLTREQPRAPARPMRGARARTSPTTDAHLQELVRRLRSGDTLAEVTRRVQPTGQRIPGVTTAATLELLRNAIRAGDTVWVGYVDTHGTASQHTIVPISMAGGTLRGHDTDTGLLDAFALHHITGVSVVEPSS
ncbi:XPB/Ssl2-like helicase family protein [Jatrophihabitans sp. GAS493]|uniref:helicase-associated domain-containing protein n=1 Tax=Jatrophihabitans sp. GAS493 TaxID=1907575 RepID=UPI000BB78B01|nr:helicase-associated domain-containing protein [Jatrophihabitans sp. GAS493]SOD70446.1 XPB/Ssl2-like helicase family protein [Jatrophihabitans sp. GAS493]